MSKRIQPLVGELPPTFLRAWREHMGLTLERVADQVDVNKGTLSRIENGATLTWGFAHAVSKAIGVPVYDLLFRHPDSEPDDFVMSEFRQADPAMQSLIANIVKTVLEWQRVAPNTIEAERPPLMINHVSGE